MPDIQITVSPAVMGLIAPGRTGPRPLCHRPTPSSARQPASGWCGRRRWTPGPPIEASRHELASQSDGLGFRGVLGRENTSLTEELTAELAGILSWSLDGLGRLTRQGKFIEPTSLHRLHLGVTGFRLPGCCVHTRPLRGRHRSGDPDCGPFRQLALVVRGQRTQAGVGSDLRT